VFVATQDVFREEPALTTPAFNRLLERLDNGVDSHGETYLEMRRRLVSYFDRRNRQTADDLADETLNRIARTLDKDGAIATTPPARYCYTVARFVLLENFRREHKQLSLDDKSWSGNVARTSTESLEPEESIEIQEQRLACLERCLEELNPDHRALVIEYYRDARRQRIERRRDMANRLGITMNALSIRVSRIRAALEASVESCRKERRQIRRCACPGVCRSVQYHSGG
jgi:DNA-directed RNA polymerase specialized sigma24 family protein